ncbi:MAG TPA: hypothetical protein DHN33_04320, partial [Eubacteriaceae bacterium]|nr:hypothetical protein [Eubacteriaceae bacterium]
IGFFFIATGMFAYLKRYFKESSKNYKEVFRYFATFKRLFFSGLFYIVGLFCHNFIYWFSPLRIVVEDSYISAPAYDMATFLAMLTNISTMVIYIVLVETKFHDRYQIYSESIVRATFKDIEKAKNDMFRLLTQQISYLVQVQAIITSILFLLAVIFLPSFGFSGIIMEVYPALAAGYFVLFVMYANLIFLYYFNDMTGAFFTSAFFLIGVILSTLVLRETSMRFYGAGVFIGAFIGWTISFFRLRYLERHFDGYIFRQGKILEETSEEMPSPISYAKEESL